MDLFIKRFFVDISPKNGTLRIQELWKMNPDFAMKCIFYVLDQRKDHLLFVTLMKWVHDNHRDSFYKNLSMVVGIYNEKTISDDEIMKIAHKDFSEEKKRIDMYIDKDHREPFLKNWISSSKKIYFEKVYKIPCYGTPSVLVSLYKEIQTDTLKWTIAHILNGNVNSTLESPFDNLKVSDSIRENKRYETFDEQYRYIRA